MCLLTVPAALRIGSNRLCVAQKYHHRDVKAVENDLSGRLRDPRYGSGSWGSSVRVWEIMSQGGGPRGGRPLPERANVAYALVRTDQAVLIIVAENEELFDNRNHGQRIHERLQGPKSYVVIPGIIHYDVYSRAFDQAIKPALEWYDRHLK